jgi:hypothetical protein
MSVERTILHALVLVSLLVIVATMTMLALDPVHLAERRRVLEHTTDGRMSASELRRNRQGQGAAVDATRAAAARMRMRQPAQALVELVLVSGVLLVLLFGVFEAAWWAYAQNVVTAAVQDGAQRASAEDGDLGRGQRRAQDLLAAGLGPSASRVHLVVAGDDQSVRVIATGQWPVATIGSVSIALPLHAEARMLREQWQP